MSTPSAEPPIHAAHAAHAATAPTPDTAAWPMFYRNPQLLSSQLHGDWRIAPAGLGFAAQANSVPIVAGEFAAASRHYAIVFAGPGSVPVVVLGFRDSNRFVTGDAWEQDRYVPAYVRRYPFVFARVAEPEGYALAIDADADMVVESGEEGTALFENGAPSELTRQALQFCEAFSREHEATSEFTRMLSEQGLLIARSADITLPDGQTSSLGGFSVVDAERFSRLPEDVIVEWHRKGWLALVHFHMASLGRMTALLAR